jgi:phage terminase small subunit
MLPSVDGRPSRLQPRADVPASLRPIIVELIASVPPEHFRPGDGRLIELYAQAIKLANEAYDELEKNGRIIDGKPSPWTITWEKAHRSAVALSARLRLAPQQREDRKTVGRQAGPPLSYYDLMRLRGESGGDDGA